MSSPSLRPLFLLAALAGLGESLAAQAVLGPRNEILPSDPAAFDNFGFAVAASEDWIVSSSPFHSGGGKVYAYKRGVVLQEFAILPADPAASIFGFSVELDGDRVLVGDPGFDASRGRVDLYEFDGAVFDHVDSFLGTNPGDEFGSALSLDLAGGWAAISAPSESGQGRVHLYSVQGGNWQHQIALGPFAGVRFGQSVDVEGGLLAVGDPGYDAARGSVRVYEWNGSQWSLRKTLIESTTVAGDNFGYSVDLDAAHLLVGAIHHAGTAADSGAGFLYRRSGNDWIDPWTLVDPQGGSGDRLGYSVQLRGEVASVAAPYHDHVYTSAGSVLQWRERNGVWIPAQRLAEVYYQNGVRLGVSHALLENETVVGATGFDHGGTDVGVVHTFERPDFALSFDTEIVTPGATVHVDHSGGEPGRPVWFYLLTFGGVPVPLKILNGVFDPNGEWKLQGNAPPGSLGGVTAQFGSFSVNSNGKIEASNRFEVTLN